MGKVEYNSIDGESWKSINGFEGLYDVSNLGRIRSYPKHQNGFKFIIKKQVIDNRGYYRVSLGKNGQKKTLKVHRVVGECFLDNKNNLPEINHKDANKLNNRSSNLEWVTRKDNMVHAYKNGLIEPANGEGNKNSKYTNDMVLDAYNSKLKPKEIAEKYKMNICSVYDIRLRRSWRHLTKKTLPTKLK